MVRQAHHEHFESLGERQILPRPKICLSPSSLSCCGLGIRRSLASLDALKAEADVDEPVASYRHLCSRLHGEDTPGRRPGGGGLRPGRARS